ncbi:hypothetical protein KC343_g17419, partial [Hortaea werneckii]
MALPTQRMLAHRAWDSLGNGALFTTRIWTPKAQSGALGRIQSLAQRGLQSRCLHNIRANQCRPSLVRQLPARSVETRRVLQTSQKSQQEAPPPAKRDQVASSDPADHDEDDHLDGDGFKRTERAAQASKLNLSAKLSKQSDDGKSGGTWREIVRLMMIARPELKHLSWAFLFLLISSSISMSVPFSIGKIMDQAASEGDKLFGLEPTHFFLALGALLATGAAANYGRIIILRIVGERIVTKLRSHLFKRTFVQNAEFFDANRVGDLISRLGSDTIIVGKSITQNVSDGLRSLVSATAGFTLMAYVS